MACIVEMVREKLGMLVYTLQHRFKAKAKRIANLVVCFALGFIFLSLGLRFLLVGCACWLNAVFSSTYLGFFIVSVFCFLMVMVILFMVRSSVNSQEVDQEKITDGQ